MIFRTSPSGSRRSRSRFSAIVPTFISLIVVIKMRGRAASQQMSVKTIVKRRTTRFALAAAKGRPVSLSVEDRYRQLAPSEMSLPATCVASSHGRDSVASTEPLWPAACGAGPLYGQRLAPPVLCIPAACTAGTPSSVLRPTPETHVSSEPLGRRAASAADKVYHLICIFRSRTPLVASPG